jgi:carboxypeptidase C (cathepsin A)
LSFLEFIFVMSRLHNVTTALLLLLLLAGEATSKKLRGDDTDGGFSGAPTSDDYLVQGLEEIEPAYATFEGVMHAGLISVNEDITDETGKLMFWMFDKDEKDVEDTLLIWFNGGT